MIKFYENKTISSLTSSLADGVSWSTVWELDPGVSKFGV